MIMNEVVTKGNTVVCMLGLGIHLFKEEFFHIQ